METKSQQAAAAKLREVAARAPMAEWLRSMIEHYQRTGTYRPEDLDRLLGDPNRRVEVKAEQSVSSLLAALGH
jgi:hypothetical protein